MTFIPLEELSKRDLTQIVSVGDSCGLAYNLRRHFNFRSANLFDWWITPSSGLKMLLSNPDIDWLYDPQNLEVTEGRRSVRHCPTGILLHHEFPRDNVSGEPISEDWENWIDEPKRRSTYLMNKFLSYNQEGERILFVRHGEDEGITDVLENLFQKAEWCLTHVGDMSKVDTWRGDPKVWDAELSPMGARLLPGKHKAFIETEAHHQGDEFSS